MADDGPPVQLAVHQLMVVRSPNLPHGIWVDATGIAVNLANPQAAQFIRACAHLLAQMEGKSQYNEPQVGEIHPGIKQFLKDVGKP